jgi:sulfatase maturation enzyme AslB (radical SAM superfamily)
MEEQVAFDALVWLLYASGSAIDLTVNFMGGEPLIRFKLIERIVPFGKRRAWQMGKTMVELVGRAFS